MAYSSLFSVIHDEKEPVGNIGRGTHYSVLSCVQWADVNLMPYAPEDAEIQKFSVIWDEDHDERVIPVIERAYIKGLMAPVKFVGERKGSLTVIVDSDFWKLCGDKREYRLAWQKVAGTVTDDWWNCEVFPENEAAESGMVHPGSEKLVVYLKNIDNLWSLGLSPYKTSRHAASACQPPELDPLI